MNRSTRLVNPFTESTFFINPQPRHLTPPFKSLPLISSPTTLLYSRHRIIHRSTTATPINVSKWRNMEPENLSSSAIDDFVRVENPDPNSVAADVLSDGTTVDDSEGGDEGGFEAEAEEEEEERESEVTVVEKPSLPEELASKVVTLSCENVNGDTCNVYLIGTAHVSQESCIEVQSVISCLTPQVVFLELCSSRVGVLTLKDLKIPTMAEMINEWKKRQNVFGILYSWFLAKVADKLEVLPGSEFRVAFEEAMRHGSKVILGDRPVQVTLRRTWGKMSLWHKIKLLYTLLFQVVFLPSPDDLNRMLKEMDDVDMLTLVIQEMSKEYPTLMETLVNERDQFMSAGLLRVAREHTSVVAVVGRGHLQGIKKNWNQPVEVAELLEIPSSRPIFSVVKVLTAVSVAVAGTAIVSGLYLASKKQT